MNPFVTSLILWQSQFAETKTVIETSLAQAVTCQLV